MYHFLGISADFSPVFHINDKSVPISAPSHIHGSCPRCGQIQVLDPSIDDNEGQMLEQVHAPPRRSELLQSERDLPHIMI